MSLHSAPFTGAVFAFPKIYMSTYRTTDLSLAATLLQQGHTLIELDKSSYRAEFVFEDCNELHESVAGYWSDELHCPAQSLLTSLKRAKHILYGYQK